MNNPSKGEWSLENYYLSEFFFKNVKFEIGLLKGGSSDNKFILKIENNSNDSFDLFVLR